MSDTYHFQVNLGGMLDVLSNHLYKSPDVFLRELLQNGVDVKAVQEVLGHEHLNTTEIYTHIDNEALRVAAKANPLSRVKIKGKIKEEPDKNHEKDEET